MKYQKPLIVVGLACMLVSCATLPDNKQNDKLILDARMEAMESQQSALRARIVSLEEAMKALEDRVSILSRNSISFQEREVVRIEPANRGKLELSSQFDYDLSDKDEVYTEIVISEDKKKQYFNTSRRVESSPSPRANTAYENVVTGDRLPTTSKQDGKASSLKKTELRADDASQFYKEGIDLYRRGLYAQGLEKFEAFLATKPDREYVDNALYWQGECHYGMGNYNEAAEIFHRIVQEYPETNKVPDAMLKVSLTYQKLGKTESAKKMMLYLMESYPASEAAHVAKERYTNIFPAN